MHMSTNTKEEGFSEKITTHVLDSLLLRVVACLYGRILRDHDGSPLSF